MAVLEKKGSFLSCVFERCQTPEEGSGLSREYKDYVLLYLDTSEQVKKNLNGNGEVLLIPRCFSP